ncbi:MAG: hypothetical protein G01um101470_1147 [Parcubacteria group bacterium Gr01-1014_70]|nr:MAG: hypothetical protein G01um101470_1147 [Parcubacteria group bacterium Gr01-1014_70]
MLHTIILHVKFVRISTGVSIGVSTAILIVFAGLLYSMGQPLICKCEYVKLWHGPTVLTSENSQHISDWYTFSHIIHGFVFYWLGWLLFGKQRGIIAQSLGVGGMFLLALLAETSWELFENTDFIINRYRSVTISYDYFGDSVLNSVSDVLFMAVGFFAAG